MSTVEPTTNEVSTRSRSRRNRGPRRPSTDKADGANGPKDSGDAAKIKRPPPVAVPVPPELFGKVSIGTVADVIIKGKSKFGFIYIGSNSSNRSELPRIYFNHKDFEEDKYPLRKGYEVEFLSGLDESGRAFASKLKLTAKGVETAIARTAKIAEERSNAARNSGENGAGEKSRRVRKERVGDDRVIPLLVTCQGKGDEKKLVEAKLTESIGKLKHTATQAFDAPVSYNVYGLITVDAPRGVLLTKAILRELKDNDVIHLSEPPASSA